MNTFVVGTDGDDSEEALSEIAQFARERGLVDDEYAQALLEREQAYPTGLPLPNRDYGIAIPHANPEYVNEHSLVLSVPDTPVTFDSMDDPAETVDARAILLLVVKDEDEYPDFLSSLISMFQRDSIATLVEDGRAEELLDRIIEECVPE